MLGLAHALAVYGDRLTGRVNRDVVGFEVFRVQYGTVFAVRDVPDFDRDRSPGLIGRCDDTSRTVRQEAYRSNSLRVYFDLILRWFPNRFFIRRFELRQ